MYACSFSSVACTSNMFYRLYNSRARAEAKLFIVEAGIGLLLVMTFVISVLLYTSSKELSFPVTDFTLSICILFSIMADTTSLLLAFSPLLYQGSRGGVTSPSPPRRCALWAFAFVLAVALVTVVTLVSHFTDRKSVTGYILPRNSDI